VTEFNSRFCRRLHFTLNSLASLHFLLHAPRANQAKHFKISNQRPGGILKSCGAIMFYKEMCCPGKTVGTKRNSKQKPGIGKPCQRNQRNYRGSTNKMQCPRQGQTVLRNIERPEFSKSFESPFHTIPRQPRIGKRTGQNPIANGQARKQCSKLPGQKDVLEGKPGVPAPARLVEF